MALKLARVTVGLAAGMLLALAVLGAQGTDPFIGTWKLNVAKSKYTSGAAPKSQTATYEAAGSGYKVSVRLEPASGPVMEWSFTTNLDGKDAPITGSNPNGDTIAAKRVNATTLEFTSRKGGKVTLTQRNVVAADGKSRTVTTTGTDAQGQKVDTVAVFEKQ